MPARSILVVLTLLILSGCLAQSSEPEPPEYHHQVAALKVQTQQQYQIPRRFTGVIMARQHAELGFELAGQLIQINVDEGDRVEQNQVLATLDTALLQRSRDELQAQRKEIAAQLKLNQQNLARIQNLNKKGFASQREQDELVSQQRVLRASRERLNAALAANQTQLDKSQLRAPFAAIVSKRLADTGTVVAAGSPIVHLLQTGAMEARVGVPAHLLPELVLQNKVTVIHNQKPMQAEVIAVNPVIDPATRTASVRLALPEPPSGTIFVDGDLIDLQLPEQFSQVGFWVPLTALSAGVRGLWNVYVLTPDPETEHYQLEARDVQIEYADLEQAYISGALADGERIVSTGLHRLTPGQTVRFNNTLAQR